jgi:hypothetical protein
VLDALPDAHVVPQRLPQSSASSTTTGLVRGDDAPAFYTYAVPPPRVAVEHPAVDEPTINVTIGRIEVRAPTPAPVPPRREETRPHVTTLAEFLAGSSRRTR